jgi:hypothetical protein
MVVFTLYFDFIFPLHYNVDFPPPPVFSSLLKMCAIVGGCMCVRERKREREREKERKRETNLKIKFRDLSCRLPTPIYVF